MNQPRSEAACSSVPLDLIVSRLTEAEEYLRKEADFNRSWADGRRGKGMCLLDEYKAYRLQAAETREAWADAIADAIKNMKNNE